MSLEVEEGFYFNVLVIPGVQFLEFPLSQKKRSHFWVFKLQLHTSDSQTLVLMSVVSSKIFPVIQFYTSFTAGS